MLVDRVRDYYRLGDWIKGVSNDKVDDETFPLSRYSS